MVMPEARGAIVSDDICNLTAVPGWQRLFLLSPFEKPVSVASQQMRALNLVHALLE